MLNSVTATCIRTVVFDNVCRQPLSISAKIGSVAFPISTFRSTCIVLRQLVRKVEAYIMATEKKNSWQLKNMSILKLKLRIDRSSLECDNRLTSRIPDPYTTNLLIISETKTKAQHGKIATRIAYAKLYWYCVYPHRI